MEHPRMTIIGKEVVQTSSRPAEEAAPEAVPLPEQAMDDVTVETFFALLEDADLHEVFADFIVPATPTH
jgi:hypothetical protein